MSKRTMGLCAAADALGKPRKALQRWRKRPGSPFASDGSVDIVELRKWALAEGLLQRPPGRPSEIDRLTEGAAPAAPVVPVPVPVTAPDAVAVAPPAPLVVAELTEGDREALTALLGDRATAIALASKVDASMLKRLAAVGRTRREIAEAERRELENQSKRGELLAAEDVRRFWAGQITIVKTHFQALPGKLTPRLVRQDYDVVYQVLEEELQGLLATFAREVPA